MKKDYQKSIMTDDLEHCYLCGSDRSIQYHHVFGASNRRKATEDGLFVPLCMDCHIKVHTEYSNRLNYTLKQRGQDAYEQICGSGSFLKRYGKSYL